LLTAAVLSRSYGYDPLGLGKDGNVEKYREYEVSARAAPQRPGFGRLTSSLLSNPRHPRRS